MTRRFLAAAVIAAAALAVAAASLLNATPAAAPADSVRGMRPTYAPDRLPAVPNEQAIVRRLWVPGLDDFYNPQGLAVADGAVLVSGYRSESYDVHRGPCRVFRIDRDSGRETGHVDVPPPCGHAGGLAASGDGMLYVADTHTLFAARLREAFSERAAPFRSVALAPGLIGALAGAAQDVVWLGSYRENGPGRLLAFAAGRLARRMTEARLTPADAAARLSIPSYAQGAAIDRNRLLWVARSDTRWGELTELDLATGAVLRRYAAPPAIEGIAFDHAGLLWVVSESGVRHDYDNFFIRQVTSFFPLVFAIDPQRLK